MDKAGAKLKQASTRDFQKLATTCIYLYTEINQARVDIFKKA